MKIRSLGLVAAFGAALGFVPAGPAGASTAQPVTLKIASGTLAGTLEIPDGTAPFPVALIVAGSGPTDRDGNSPMLPGKNDSLKLLADGLAAHGIASLRYDKRGIAGSASALQNESQLRFNDGVDDALGWMLQLAADKRFDRFYIIGHSEGSLIGMLAAQKRRINGFISLEGAALPAGQELIRQLQTNQTPPDMMTKVQSIVPSLEAGTTVPDPGMPLSTLFRASIQPYLISWFKYDPLKEIVKFGGTRILIVQGTHDLQIPVEDGKRLAAAAPGARLAIVPDMNHVLKAAPEDRAANFKAYSDPSLPLAPGLLDAIVTFIQDRPH